MKICQTCLSLYDPRLKYHKGECCKPEFECRLFDPTDDSGTWRKVRSHSPSDAAEQYADGWNSYHDHIFTEDSPQFVIVRRMGETKEHMIEVHAEETIKYTSKLLHTVEPGEEAEIGSE